MTDLADTGRVPRPRLVGPDVTRAIALVGVVIMNFHGYLNGGDDHVNRSLAERIFDPTDGPLTTRFAAAFVLVAGMGVTMLTNRSRLSGDRAAIRDDRWRLARRGLLLFSFGLLIEWIWPGTILFYYGAYFMVASLLFTLRVRWLVVIGSVATLAAAGIAWFRLERMLDGHSTAWLEPEVTSPRNLLLRTFVGYTHPLLPWLAFVCAGIILGRSLDRIAELRGRLMIGGLIAFAGTYLVNFVGIRWATHGFTVDDTWSRRWRGLLSTGPYDRGLLYTVGTLGIAIVAYGAISWIAERYPTAGLTQLFQHAGQMTLSLYLLHVVTFNAVVHWWHWVRPTGLDTALVFSLVFWVLAISVGALWHRFAGMGPLERIYRNFGG
ncbi:MAG: hypothetical protein JWM34_1811 [Ilumatobacteraceae bacterium]|nr:hypothetical protein [Ilumatobacteraceae bacterium]